MPALTSSCKKERSHEHGFLSWMLSVVSMTGLLLLNACVATNPATGQRQFVLMSEEQEFEMGHEVASASLKEFGGLYKEKPPLNTYLQQRVADIVRVSERPDKPFTFRLLNSEIFNAFAVPGYTMLTRGTLAYLQNEAQLTAILGHEVGHVTARHSVAAHRNATLTQIGLIGLNVLLASKGYSNSAMSSINQGTGVAADLFFAGYSRTQELEADRLGLRYTRLLGYHPQQAAEMFRIMGRRYALQKKIYSAIGINLPDSFYHRLLSSHPDDQRRFNELMQAAGHNLNGVINANRYLDRIDTIAFGPEPSKGVGGKHRYYNPKHRVFFELPKAFYIPQDDQLPLAIDPDTQGKIELLYKSVPENQDVEESLIYTFPKARDIKPLRIGNNTFYTATFPITELSQFGVETEKYHVRLIGFMRDVLPELTPSEKVGKSGFYALMLFSPPEHFAKLDAQFLSISESIRLLSTKQAETIQPLRIKIRTVQKGDTAHSLAHSLPFARFQDDWFALLNGLEIGAALKEGQRVKLIVDPNERMVF